MLDRSKLALIHVAQGQLGLDDDEYRTILHSVCGVESAKDIKSDDDFKALMKAFERLGFKQEKVARRAMKFRRDNDAPATPDQMAIIEETWKRVTREPEEWQNTLANFLHSRFHVPKFALLTRRKASDVIEALKAMYLRTVLSETHQTLFPGKEFVPDQLLRHWSKFIRPLSHDSMEMLLTVLSFYNDEFRGLVNHLAQQQGEPNAEDTETPHP